MKFIQMHEKHSFWEGKINLQHCGEDNYDGWKETGYTKDEFKELICNKKDKLLNYIGKVQGGMAGFDTIWGDPKKIGERSFIAYATTKKPQGKINFPTENEVKTMNLKTFLKFMEESALLIVVTTSEESYGESEAFRNSPIYRNRGIFRTLYAELEDEAPRQLAMKLHGFTAKVWKEKLDSEKKYLTVAPLPAMQAILKNNFKSNELFVGMSADGANSKDSEPFSIAVKGSKEACEIVADLSEPIQLKKSACFALKATGGIYEQSNLIKIEALISKFDQFNPQFIEGATDKTSKADKTTKKPGARHQTPTASTPAPAPKVSPSMPSKVDDSAHMPSSDLDARNRMSVAVPTPAPAPRPNSSAVVETVMALILVITVIL